MICNTFAVVLVVVVSVTAIEAKAESCPGFTWDEECFYVILSRRKTVKYNSAENICLEDGGHPANIYDRAHYNEVLTYLRPMATNSIQVWLGMTYDPEKNIVKLYNGTVSEFVDWRPIYPLRRVAFSHWTHMVVYARDEPSITEGMGNIAPTIKLWGVLCEKPTK